MPTLTEALAHRDLRNVLCLSHKTPLGPLDLVLPRSFVPSDTGVGAANRTKAAALLACAVAARETADNGSCEEYAKEALAHDPFDPRPYRLLAGLYESAGEFAAALFAAKQLLAVEPTFANLTRIAALLGRAARFDEARVVSTHQWETRNVATADEAVAATLAYLVTLHRLAEPALMVHVAATAIADYGPRAALVYQLVLAHFIRDHWDHAERTLATHLPHIRPDDPYLPMLRDLAALIARHLGRRVA